MQLTKEQQKIVAYDGDLIVIKAFAGSGKTSTLIAFAKANPTKQFLYIAFNRAIKDEAVLKFPKNVECKTAHQLAYASFGRRYRQKLKNNISNQDIATVINSDNWSFINRVRKTLNTFFASSDRLILSGHVVVSESDSSALTAQHDIVVLDREEVASAAMQIWLKMQDLNDPMPISHDAYLKMYQLSQPDLSIIYSYILIDEAQDITPVVNALVLNQSCKLIYVGDPHQQIYRWRGAENAMEYSVLRNADKLHLTHSFRFGEQIAMVANTILEYKEETLHIVGKGGEDNVYMTLEELEKKSPLAILSRTVADVINNAVKAVEEDQRIYWVGGISSYGLESIEDLDCLANNQLDKIKDKHLINQFPTYDAYVAYSEESNEQDMIRNVSLLNKYNDIRRLIWRIRKNTVTEEKKADVILSTIHRSKGLEWENVMISDDFFALAYLQTEPERLNDELNLLYVAVTRATKNLIINTIVRHIMTIIITQRLERTQDTSNSE